MNRKYAEFYKLSHLTRTILNEIRAWEDRKMLAECRDRNSKLLLPPSSPVAKYARKEPG